MGRAAADRFKRREKPHDREIGHEIPDPVHKYIRGALKDHAVFGTGVGSSPAKPLGAASRRP